MTYELDIGEHQRGLRRIALRLVRDEASADDLVQETWLAALEHPPSRFDGFKGWLKTVLVHNAGRAARRDARRRERERLAARLEVELPHHPVEAESPRAELDGALDALGEPYASALRARYLEDLSYEEAGKKLGRPADTVRTQVRRGLASLRERLARRFDGDRRAMGLALIGAFDWSAADVHGALAAQGVASAGGLAALWKALGIALVVGAAGLVVWSRARSEPERPIEVALASPERPREGGGPPRASPPAARAAGRPLVAREALGPDAPATRPAGAEPAAADPRPSCEVRVVDAGGRPLAGARVHLEDADGERVLGPSGADGLVRVRVDEERLLTAPLVEGRFLALWATADGHASSQRALVPWPLAAEGPIPIGLRGPELVLRGRVEGTRGEPVAGARLAVLNDCRRMPEKRERTVTEPPRVALGGADGSFEIRHLEQGPLTLHAWAAGRGEQAVQVVAPEAGTVERTIVLSPGATVTGVVRDESGAPAPGAVVAQRWPSAEGPPQVARSVADENGRYALVDQSQGNCYLVASGEAGTAQAVVPLAAGETTELDLVLRPSHPLRARLVDEDGRPFTRARFVFATYAALRESEPIAGWLVHVEPDEDGMVSLDRTPEEPIYGGAVAQDTGQSFPLAWTRWDEPDPEVRRLVCRVEPASWGSIGGLLLDHLERPCGGLFLRATALESMAVIGEEVLPDGSFLVANVPPGEYRLSIAARGVGLVVFRDVSVAAGERVDVGALRLPVPGELSIDWGFAPEAGYSVIVAQMSVEPGFTNPFTMIHAGGPEELQGLSSLPGRYALFVLAGERIVQGRQVELRSGRSHRVPLGPDAPMLGTFDARAPSPDAPREARFAFYGVAELALPSGPLDADALDSVAALEPDSTRTVALGPDGWFRCEHELPFGRWAVLVETPDGRTAGALAAPHDEMDWMHVELELE